MTYQSKYQQNKCLIKRYLDFLPEVQKDKDKLKLICEIARLHHQNKIIEHEDNFKDR